MTPKEETLKFIEKKVQKEKDKWEVGNKNNYLSWSSFKQDFENLFNNSLQSNNEIVELHNEIKHLKTILKERFGYEVK